VADEKIKTDIPGYRLFDGMFMPSWGRVILFRLIFAFIPFALIINLLRAKESLLIGKDSIILQIQGKKIELKKSEIKSIKKYRLAISIRIYHNNPFLPEILLFQSYRPASFVISTRELYDFGYPGIKDYY